MSEPTLFMSRRGFIGAMSAVVATAIATPKLPAAASSIAESNDSDTEVLIENWLTVQALVANCATDRDRKKIEGECRRALREGFRKRGLRPVGKPRMRKEYVPRYRAVMIVFDQIGVKPGCAPTRKLPE